MKIKVTCHKCGNTVHTETLSSIRTDLCPDCYMVHGINVPAEWWKGNTEELEMYGNELGMCVVCNRQTSKRCKLCHEWNCRPTEWSGDCMEIHLREKHRVYFSGRNW